MSLVVYSYAELKDAIVNSLDNYIILGNDITYDNSGGILIPLSTTEITIDGKDPITGENHFLKDRSSAARLDTITTDIRSTELNVYVKNITLYIRNYFGLISSIDNSNNTQIYIKYENVDFFGVQVTFNRYGTTHIKDSNIIVDKYDSINNAQEVAETNKIIFEGNLNIVHYSTSDSFLWLSNSNPSFTVKENSNINIKIHSRELIYSNINTVDMIFEKNSTFILETQRGLFYDSALTQRAKNFIVEEDCIIRILQTGTGLVETLPIDNDLYIGPNTIFNIFQSVNTSFAVIGIKSSNKNITFDNPKNVVLYCTASLIFSFLGSGSIDINSQQLNYWNFAKDLDIAGKIDDVPNSTFRKSNRSNVSVNVAYTSSSTYILSSNISSEDEGYPLDNTTFNLGDAKVISLGILDATINDIRDNSLLISGNTDPVTELRTSILGTTYDEISDSFGDFSITINDYISKNTELIFKFNKNFLHTFKKNVVIGSLTLQVTDRIIYRTRCIPLKEGLIKRKTEFKIIIKDTRVNASNFYLYAHIGLPLTSDIATIDDVVMYKDSHRSSKLKIYDTLVYEGEGNKQDETITILEYQEVDGLLLELEASYNYLPGKYIGKIIWSLKEQPINDEFRKTL